jgi:CRP-like cAMP-binding protein
MHEGRDVVLARMGAGECFGEMALVRDDIRTATVVAERDCAALCFERVHIDAHPQSAHLIYKNIAAILAKRLEERSL